MEMSLFACHSHPSTAGSSGEQVRSGSLDWLQRQSWVLWCLCDLCTETFTWCTQLWACDIIEGCLKFFKSVLSLPPQRKSCVQEKEISCEIFSAIVKFPQTGKTLCLESTIMEKQCVGWLTAEIRVCPAPHHLLPLGMTPWPGFFGEWGSH